MNIPWLQLALHVRDLEILRLSPAVEGGIDPDVATLLYRDALDRLIACARAAREAVAAREPAPEASDLTIEEKPAGHISEPWRTGT